jgi:hypothetical protein
MKPTTAPAQPAQSFGRLVRNTFLRPSRCQAPGTAKAAEAEKTPNPFVFTDLSSLSHQTFIL